MGGSSSKTLTEQINENITNIAIRSSQQCSVVVDQEQSSTIVNTGTISGTNIGMNQATDINLSCMMTSGQFVDMQRSIANVIAQEAKAKGDAVISVLGASEADAEAKIHNIIKNNVTVENVNKSMIAIRQRQKLNLTNAGTITDTNINMNQGAEVFAAAVMDQVTKTGIIENIENNSKNSADAETTNPLSFITDLAGVVLSPIQSIMNIGTFFMILIFCVVAYVIYTSVINPKPRPQEPLRPNLPASTALSQSAQQRTTQQPLTRNTTPSNTAASLTQNTASLTQNTASLASTGLRNRAATMPGRLGTVTNTALSVV